jgi:hypothetical protein
MSVAFESRLTPASSGKRLDDVDLGRRLLEQFQING